MSKQRLSSDELTFLKLFVHGYNNSDFLRYFSLDEEVIAERIMSIQCKFRVKNWQTIIKKAFHEKILKPADFTERSIKELSSKFAIRIFNEHQSKTDFDFESLKETLMDFIYNCNHELAFNRSIEDFEQKTLSLKLKLKERKLIELVYIGIWDERKIAKLLLVPIKKVSVMKQNILYVLSANSWYNAIRKAFQLNILSKQKYASVDLKQEMEMRCQLIIGILTEQNSKEIKAKLKIYDELLDFYNVYEYSCLLRKDFDEHKITLMEPFRVARIGEVRV